MIESRIAPAGEKKEQISFTAYIKEKYKLYHLFLPGYKPANDVLLNEEIAELDSLIENRDHFEIRKLIASRYSEQN